MKKIQKMSTCNRLDLETPGSRPVMLQILPEHCLAPSPLLHCHGFADPVCLLYSFCKNEKVI